MGKVVRSLAVRMVEASRRFEVVRLGQLASGGSLFRKLLSSLAQIWGSVLTMNCFTCSKMVTVIMKKTFSPVDLLLQMNSTGN